MLEPVRILADWLEGLTLDFQSAAAGVNACIAQVPRDGSDAAPPNLVRVVDVTRDDNAARGHVGQLGFPFLVVEPGDPFDFIGEVETVIRDGTCGVRLNLVTKKLDTAKGNQDAIYLTRAALHSVRRLMEDDNFAARNRNGIQLLRCQRMRYNLSGQEIGGAVLASVVLLTFDVRDTQP